MNPIYDLFTLYYYFRQHYPIFFYIYYLHVKDKPNPQLDKIIDAILVLIGLIISYAAANCLLNVPFSAVIPFNWQYSALITWGIFFLIYFRKSFIETFDKLSAFTLSLLAAVGGGWLYEIPFFNPLKMFIAPNSLLFVNGQIICLILLGYELKKRNFKMNVSIYITSILLIIVSAILFLFDTNFIYGMYELAILTKKISGNKHLFTWILRLPTCLFLISLLGGISDKEN